MVEESQTLVCCLNDVRVGGRVEVQNFVQIFGFWHEQPLFQTLGFPCLYSLIIADGLQ